MNNDFISTKIIIIITHYTHTHTSISIYPSWWASSSACSVDSLSIHHHFFLFSLSLKRPSQIRQLISNGICVKRYTNIICYINIPLINIILYCIRNFKIVVLTSNPQYITTKKQNHFLFNPSLQFKQWIFITFFKKV
jgi:hypothetical protein